MGRYVLRRLLWMPLVLLVLVTVSFFLIRLAPGSPFSRERALDPDVLANLNLKYGLDLPAWKQYLRYLDLLLHGDLGLSTKWKESTVNEIIARGIGPTLLLGGLASVLALAIGLTAGVIGAVRQNSVFDYGAMSVATFGMSVPNYVTGPILVLLFAMTWKLLPVTWSAEPVVWVTSVPLAIAALHVAWRNRERIRAGPGRTTLGREVACVGFPLLAMVAAGAVATLAANPKLILPSVTLALPFASRIARLMRAGMLEVVGQDYVRTARAKGLPESVVVARHALKGGILPVVSFLGPAIAGILTGSLVVERIFGVPGIGREFVEAALNRDYFLVLGIVVLDGVLLVGFNLVVDVVYGFLDPRIRYD